MSIFVLNKKICGFVQNSIKLVFGETFINLEFCYVPDNFDFYSKLIHFDLLKNQPILNMVKNS